MKVSELIELLSKQNPEATVIAYSQIDEGGDYAGRVLNKAESAANLYYKCDAPISQDDEEDFITIC